MSTSTSAQNLHQAEAEVEGQINAVTAILSRVATSRIDEALNRCDAAGEAAKARLRLATSRLDRIVLGVLDSAMCAARFIGEEYPGTAEPALPAPAPANDMSAFTGPDEAIDLSSDALPPEPTPPAREPDELEVDLSAEVTAIASRAQQRLAEAEKETEVLVAANAPAATTATAKLVSIRCSKCLVTASVPVGGPTVECQRCGLEMEPVGPAPKSRRGAYRRKAPKGGA